MTACVATFCELKYPCPRASKVCLAAPLLLARNKLKITPENGIAILETRAGHGQSKSNLINYRHVIYTQNPCNNNESRPPVRPLSLLLATPRPPGVVGLSYIALNRPISHKILP